MADPAGALFASGEKRPLTPEESAAAITCALEGRVSPLQIARLLTALHRRGETIDEIEGCVRAMLRRAIRIPVDHPYIVDLGGTGGDGAGTFNISTTAALVVAAAGVPVVKHGNVAMTGTSGSLDMLRELGVLIPTQPDVGSLLLRLEKTGFAVAPTGVFHRFPAAVTTVRRSLPFRTVFNLAGPLAHPATTLLGQVVGVPTPELTEQLAEVLRRLGINRATVLHGQFAGEAGVDEPSLGGPTRITALRGGRISTSDLVPEDVGLARAGREALVASDAAASATTCRQVLLGKRGPARDVVVLSAGVALWTIGREPSIAAGTQRAADVTDSGAAARLLDRLRSHRSSRRKVAPQVPQHKVTTGSVDSHRDSA